MVRPGRKCNTFVLSIRLKAGCSHLEIIPKSIMNLSDRPQTLYVLGAFSKPHASVEKIILHHIKNSIEVDAKSGVELVHLRMEGHVE